MSYKFIYALKIDLPLTNGNTGRGNQWYASAKERKKFEALLREITTPDPDTFFDYLDDLPFEFPVGLRITRVLGRKQRLWDADSIGRGNSKELVDAIVAVGFLHDDSAAYVKHVEYQQIAQTPRPKFPYILVEFFRYDEEN